MRDTKAIQVLLNTVSRRVIDCCEGEKYTVVYHLTTLRFSFPINMLLVIRQASGDIDWEATTSE